MTELILGLAWPVAVVVVAGLVVHFASGLVSRDPVSERPTEEEIERLEARITTAETHASDTRARLRQVEETQERHATLLAKQGKGGQL